MIDPTVRGRRDRGHGWSCWSGGHWGFFIFSVLIIIHVCIRWGDVFGREEVVRCFFSLFALTIPSGWRVWARPRLPPLRLVLLVTDFLDIISVLGWRRICFYEPIDDTLILHSNHLARYFVVKRASNVHVWGVCAFHRFIMRKVMNDEERYLR